MRRKIYILLTIVTLSSLCFSGRGFGQSFVPGESTLQQEPDSPISDTHDRLGLRDTPEDLMKALYDVPVGPSRLIQRNHDDGGKSGYGSFYFSDDPLLSELVDTAIYANPAIWESEHRWRAALQRVPQARTLPDPMVTITHFLQETETRVGPQKDMVSISQKFPWFGKLDARGEMALRDALAAVEQYQAQIREVVLAVKRAYYDLAYLDEAVTITEEDKKLLEHFEEIAETRYSTGKGIQQAVIKIQAEITRDDDRLYMLRQQRETAVANLNTLLNRPPHEPVPALAALSIPGMELDAGELYAVGRANRHELKAGRYMVEKSEQAIRLAKKEYFPDFTLGFNYIFVDDREDDMGKLSPPEDNGRDAYAVMVGFNIPLWEGKNMSAVRDAREIRRANENSYDKMVNSIEFSVRDGVLRAETTYDQLALYDKVLIPQAEQSLDSTQAAYATGKLNALELIDSERFLLNVRLAHAKLKADYMKALADIERAIGTAFPAEI